MANINNYINRQVPTVLYCEKEYNLLPGECYGPIIRNVYIIECCVEGYGSVIINEKEFSISPGDCYILFPGDTVIHTADSNEPRKGYWCAVDGLDLGFVFKEAGISSDFPFAPPELFSELCNCIQKMVAEWGCGDAGESLRETSCIYILYHLKIPLFPPKPSLQYFTTVLPSRKKHISNTSSELQ